MYKVQVKNKGKSEVYVKSPSGEFVIDTEAKSSVAPLDAFLASLGACISYYIRKFAASANIQIDLFTVDVEAELVSDKGYRFKDLRVSIDLNGANIDDARKQSLLQFVKNCPVHNTLRNSPEIDIKIA
ncbi:MAG: OsmC family protein [Candidatus Margulisiibacteriota bacterium]